ncbi:MAG: sulfurtransferase [Legionellales bacterium]|nr:sulfurtransferase [Legionellales bacterium]
MITNISGYKFVTLDNLLSIKTELLTFCNSQAIKGTILLSSEGVNIMLAAEFAAIQSFEAFLRDKPCFSDITFKYSESEHQSYKRMFVKLKKEIITMKQTDIRPDKYPAPSVKPEVFKKWMDQNKVIVIDTRNDYEYISGSFINAIKLNISSFSEFPSAIEQISSSDKEKPVVVFCTGGIRCEKAAPYMLQHGFKEVYQLEGGILNYFDKCKGAPYYDGDCFVFDERIAVNTDLKPVSGDSVK